MNTTIDDFTNPNMNDPEDKLQIILDLIREEIQNKYQIYLNSLAGSLHHEYAINTYNIAFAAGCNPYTLASTTWQSQYGTDIYHDIAELHSLHSLELESIEARKIAETYDFPILRYLPRDYLGYRGAKIYDFGLDLLVTPNTSEIYSRFFKLKLLQIDILLIPEFLTYQFIESFDSKEAGFVSFLKLMIRSDRNSERPTLIQDRVDTVMEWLEDSNKFALNLEEIEEILPKQRIRPELLTPIIEEMANKLSKHKFPVFLNAYEVAKMKSAGFAIPKNRCPFDCEFSHKNIHIIYDMAGQIKKTLCYPDYDVKKADLCKYIKGWFTHFGGHTIHAMSKSIKIPNDED